MFGNLVESGSHRADLKRRSSFFIGTLVFYAVVLSAAGVGSIYAYNTRLDETAELELTTMLRFPVQAEPREEERTPPRAAPQRRAAPAAASGDARPFRPAVVTEEWRNNANLSNRAATRNDAPELPPGAVVDVGPANVPAIGGNTPAAANTPAGGATNGSLVAPDAEQVPERRARVEPTPQPEAQTPRGPVRLSSGVIAGKATSKPAPAYPEIAKMAGASGTVAVQVVVDEQGRVISAQATSGHPMLRKAAVDAALRARFSPTLLSGVPVKVTGLINYNFVLN